MSITAEVEALRRIPYFATTDSGKLKLLAFASERLTLAAGGTLFHQGDPGDAAYIVLSGEAEIVAEGKDGKRVSVVRLHNNALIGEIALLRNVPRTATVVAATPMVVLKIGKDSFFQLLRDVPSLALELMRELAERVEDTTVKLREATLKLKDATA